MMQDALLLKKKAAVASKTVLLMSLNGDLVDQVGSTGITATGNSWKTNQKFGRQAASFTTSGYIAVPTTAKLQFAGDFTIEMWISMSRLTGEQMLFTAGPGMYIDCYTGVGYNGGLPCFICSNSQTNDHTNMVIGSNPFTVGTLHHLAFVRSAGIMSVYGDGASLGTPVANSTVWANSSTIIGNYVSSPAYGFGGGVQEVRLSNVCRYTGPFTPPTGPFTLD
uniref:Concanavalin A-like lectin/glucanase superfamily protein n=1 Tax=Burkholderia phage vB_BgluM-SURPRISE13 TaxID=3159457 RepID=A0AAU7PF48_9VIRU